MTASVDPDRSRQMALIRSVDTKPEMLVRRLAHRLGFRFRLHRKDLPGKPDLVFPGRRAAVFVHGCYWHGHGCKRGARMPKTNVDYWTAKIGRNRERDEANVAALEAAGWRVLVVWECELKDTDGLAGRLQGFLSQPSSLGGL
ncbi:MULTISPECIES: very short patch repair endonuclease [unclassified Mesorhizobium]|uniref:very short patch repair endonuclease n=1 Tax=unclassified Mesorhizobium TaxID=325217 RepID=UPI000FCADA69|nr:MULTISPECIES: DNA mismatch endonuclease Vsr [unclassified Mesorhizobium]RUU25222.1 DNA mismatch endonuclease Vsr [Mesorhizobium sp. M6A.T.Ce.TU.016.01.1.1]TIQ79912.1 MAG: DNA mismatch endonuclease Vsr [Mesorhizobium sp.]